MILLRYVLLMFIGLTSGALVAAGLFTFITSLGIVNRLAETTKTARFIHYYEDCVILGGVTGVLYSVHALKLPPGNIMLGITGLFSGIFVGCLIGSIAEIVNAFPIFLRRFKLKTALAAIVLSLALGKFVGVLLQYFI